MALLQVHAAAYRAAVIVRTWCMTQHWYACQTSIELFLSLSYPWPCVMQATKAVPCQVISLRTRELPEWGDSMVQELALPFMHVYADIAKVVATLVWKQLTCKDNLMLLPTWST